MVVVATAACTRPNSVVAPNLLASNASEIVQRGAVTVYSLDSKSTRVAATDEVDVVLSEGDTQHLAHLSVREFVHGCQTDVTALGCLAQQTHGRPVTIRHRAHFDAAKFATGLTFGVMGGAIGTCIATCEGGAELRKDLAYGAIGVAVTIGVFVLLTSLGHD
jgi:hypothetical protein